MNLPSILDVMLRENPDPDSLALLRKKLPFCTRIEDPFLRDAPGDDPDRPSRTLLLSRQRYVDALNAVLVGSDNIVISGRPGAGKSALYENAPVLCPQEPATLVVKWTFVPRDEIPEEALYFEREMLIQRIFVTYWKAFCNPEVQHPFVPTLRDNSWWMDTLRRFYQTRYLSQEGRSNKSCRTASDLGLEEYLNTPVNGVQFFGDELKLLISLVIYAEDASPNLTLPQQQGEAELRKQMTRWLSDSELEALCFDLGVNYDEVGKSSKSNTIINLLIHLQRRSQGGMLSKWLRDTRPDQAWIDPYPRVSSSLKPNWAPYQRIRVFVDGVDKLAPETQIRLLNESVALSNWYQGLQFAIFIATQPTIGDDKPLKQLVLNEWHDDELEELLAQRVVSATDCQLDLALDWPTFFHLDQELTLAAKHNLKSIIIKGARRVYDSATSAEVSFGNFEEAPIHALRLARGVICACANHRSDPNSAPPSKLELGDMKQLVDYYWEHLPPMPKKTIVPSFQGRKKEINLVCTQKGKPPQLVCFSGEAGIGKTRLLAEIAAELRGRSRLALVSYVDLASLKGDVLAERVDSLLEILGRSTDGRLRDINHTIESGAVDRAVDIVEQLRVLPGPAPVLIFDTHEAIYDDMPFRDWFEKHLVSPLLNTRRVRIVFAGRVLVPWRTHAVRQFGSRSYGLEPLAVARSEQPAKNLVRNVLNQQNPTITSPQPLDSLVTLVLDLSCGHPKLSTELACWLVEDNRWKDERHQTLRVQMAQDVVRPFVEGKLFSDTDQDWVQILQLASILPWFDSTILREYLHSVEPGLAPIAWDAFFNQGVDQLRRQVAAVTWVQGGYRLNGVICDITRRCLELTNLDLYQRAVAAATELWQRLIDDLELDSETYRRFEGELRDFRRSTGQEQSR